MNQEREQERRRQHKKLRHPQHGGAARKITLWVLTEQDENGVSRPMTNIYGGIHRVRADTKEQAVSLFRREGGIPRGAKVEKLLQLRDTT